MSAYLKMRIGQRTDSVTTATIYDDAGACGSVVFKSTTIERLEDDLTDMAMDGDYVTLDVKALAVEHAAGSGGGRSLSGE